jgi:hypothetical protein
MHESASPAPVFAMPNAGETDGCSFTVASLVTTGLLAAGYTVAVAGDYAASFTLPLNTMPTANAGRGEGTDPRTGTTEVQSIKMTCDETPSIRATV